MGKGFNDCFRKENMKMAKAHENMFNIINY
jgi:hypothetical protein